MLVPLVEGGALLVLVGIAARPGPVPRSAQAVVLSMFYVLALANAGAAAQLVATALVLLTNVVSFGLLYWQVDGGGPARRVAEPAPFPDFQFAFSPTDTVPLTLRVEALMRLQSLISVSVLGVVLGEEAGDDLGSVGGAPSPPRFAAGHMPGDVPGSRTLSGFLGRLRLLPPCSARQFGAYPAGMRRAGGTAPSVVRGARATRRSLR